MSFPVSRFNATQSYARKLEISNEIRDHECLDEVKIKARGSPVWQLQRPHKGTPKAPQKHVKKKN